MATFESKNFGENMFDPHSAGEVMVMDETVELPATLALADIAKIGHLPAGCVPLDMIVHMGALETGTAALVVTAGILDDDETGLVAAGTFAVATAVENTAVVARGTGTGMAGIAPSANERVLALKVTTAAATAAAGNIRVIMTYRTANYGA